MNRDPFGAARGLDGLGLGGLFGLAGSLGGDLWQQQHAAGFAPGCAQRMERGQSTHLFEQQMRAMEAQRLATHEQRVRAAENTIEGECEVVEEKEQLKLTNAERRFTIQSKRLNK